MRSRGAGSKPICWVIQGIPRAHSLSPRARLALFTMRLQAARENAQLLAQGDAEMCSQQA